MPIHGRKRIWRRLLYPSKAVAAVLTAVGAALLAAILAHGASAPALVCAACLFAAYALAALCARLPALRRRLLSLPRLQRYRADARLRVTVSLHVSLTLNVPYAAMQFWLGLRQGALWFYALAGYYALLAVMRHLLLRYIRTHRTGRDRAAEFRLYRLCGALLVAMTFVLVVVVYGTVWQGRGLRNYPLFATLAMAAYTAFTLTLAIVNDVRYRRESPVLSAARTIRLAAALVSVLSLAAALLAAFGGSSLLRRWLLAATGSAICAIVLTTAIGMIARANAALRQLPPASRRT